MASRTIGILRVAVVSLLALVSTLSCKEEDRLTTDPVECSQPIQGRLAIKGICMNYVLEVLDPINPEWVETEWVHPDTQVSYTNAFRLGSVCTFDDSLNEGDLLYFEASPEPFKGDENCAVCLAYSPTPNKTLYLRLCN
jgi:CRISPR/Cas system CMR subunit Cmr6 (Cas7 group RAMP superfamily)